MATIKGSKQFMVNMDTYEKWYTRTYYSPFQFDKSNHIVTLVTDSEQENPMYDERRGVWMYLVEQGGVRAYIPQHFLVPFS